MDTRKKILPVEDARRRIESLRAEGKSIAVVYGWFDILRAGHASALAQAKEGCDELLVLVRPDSETHSTVLDEWSRAQLVAALGVVDIVVLCDRVGQEELLKALSNAPAVDADQAVTGSVIEDVLRRHGRG